MQNVRKLRLSVAVLCGAGLLYAIGCSPSTGMTKYRKGDLAMLKVPGVMNPVNPKYPEAPVAMEPPAAPPPDVALTGPNGHPVKLTDLKGKVLVVNLWATWCVPCRTEMPTLAALQKAYEGKDVMVIAVNSDVPADLEKARAQLAGTPPLKFYSAGGIDYAFKFQPGATNFPTTFFYGKDGMEVARLEGPADWNGREAHALIDALLKG